MALSIFLLIAFIVVSMLLLRERLAHTDTKRVNILRLDQINRLEARVNLLNWDANGNARLYINKLADQVHQENRKWWTDLDTGVYPIDRNKGELLALVHSEISEALEGVRKNLQDDKLPHRSMFEVELADAVIRIFDIAAGFELDLGGAYVEKMEFNTVRKDHTLEHRKGEHGKKF